MIPLRLGALLVAVVAVVTYASFTCEKREEGYHVSYAAQGWDKCDANTIACCYYFNDSVIIYSHGYKNGSYHPNTHCEYIFDFDPDCDIVFCMQIDFSMNEGDQIKISGGDANIEWRGSKQPFNSKISGNKASLAFNSFNSQGSQPAADTKWSVAAVCLPKGEYKSVCEVCDDVSAKQLTPPASGNLQVVNEPEQDV